MSDVEVATAADDFHRPALRARERYVRYLHRRRVEMWPLGAHPENTGKYMFFPMFLSSHGDERVGTGRHVVALPKISNMSHPRRWLGVTDGVILVRCRSAG